MSSSGGKALWSLFGPWEVHPGRWHLRTDVPGSRGGRAQEELSIYQIPNASKSLFITPKPLVPPTTSPRKLQVISGFAWAFQ